MPRLRRTKVDIPPPGLLGYFHGVEPVHCVSHSLLWVLALAAMAAPSGAVLAGHATHLPAALGPAAGGLTVPKLSPGFSPAVRPAAAIALTIPGATPTAAELSWSATNDLFFSHYTVYESPNGSTGSFQSVAVISSQSTTTFVATTLTPGLPYWWQVTESGLGTSTSAIVNDTQPTLADLNYTTPTSSTLWFNWTNNASYGGDLGFVSYQVWESVGGSAPTVAASGTGVSTRTATVTGLSSGASYLFYLNTTDCVAACGTGTSVNVVTESNSVTYGAPLPLAANVVESRSVVDVGQPDLFTCSPAGGVSPFTFAWDLGNGTYVPGGASLSVSFGSPGPVFVTCRVTDAGRSTATASTSATVNPAPMASASANRSALDAGQSVAFSCTAANGTSPYTVSWSYGDGSAASGGFQTHSYSSAGAFNATCFVTDTAGVTVLNSTSLVVDPPLTLLVTRNSGAAAPLTSLEFTVIASNGSGTYPVIDWTFGDGTSATGATVSHPFTVAGNYSVTVRVVDSNGGTSSATLGVLISTIRASFTVSSLSVQTGAPVAYTATALGGSGGGYNYTWWVGGARAGFGPSLTEHYSAAGPEVAYVLVRDNLGGTANLTAPTVTVTAPPTPPPSYTWLYLLALGIVLVVFVGLLYLRQRRHALDEELQGHVGRIPPTDPHEVTRGAKICRNCGTSNLPVRETCVACGRPLRRGLT